LLPKFLDLWAANAEAFCQARTWRRAERLSLDVLACIGRHQITKWLAAGGRLFQDWSADYRFFSEDVWDPRALFRPIFDGVIEFLSPGGPVVSALDDTRLKKTGTKIPGVSYQRDPLSPHFHTNLVRSLRYLQMSLMLPGGELPGPARSIPVRFQHVPPVPKPKKKAPEEVWKAYRKKRRAENLSTHAVAMLRQVRAELDEVHHAHDRILITGVDGSYCNKTTLRARVPRHVLIARIRKDAVLSYLPTPDDQRARGTRRKYGQPVPTPEALLKDESVPFQDVQAFAAGQLRTFRVKTIGPVLWAEAGADLPLRLVVIAPVGYRLRAGGKLLYRQPAFLICTDPNLPLQKIVQYYLWRWDIEGNHRDEKQLVRVQDPQVWSALSVDRAPPFAVATYARLLLAGAQALGRDATEPTFPQPKWRACSPKRRLSTSDYLQQLRSEVWRRAIPTLAGNSGHFLTTPSPATKSPESHLPIRQAVLYYSDA